MNVDKYCVFASDVIDVYEATRDSKLRNDLYYGVIIPVLQVIYDRASRWEIDGEEVDLILDNHSGSFSEPDSFMEKISPEVAYEYLAAHRKHYEISSRFEYVVNHPVAPAIEDTTVSSIEALKRHIDMMKDKLDAASELLDISFRTRIDDLEFDPIVEKLSSIIRETYKNIVPDDDLKDAPAEVVEEKAEETTEKTPEETPEEAPAPSPVIDLEAEEDKTDIA